MTSPSTRSSPAGKAHGTLGTFGGVFTPSVLTILGLILFLRLGYVVGEAGLARALLILGLATSISVLTSTSLSAIATNRKVRGGGDYYLISRSLGVAYGGALGLILFFAQAISVGFYCVGFGEGVAAIVGEGSPITVTAAAGVAALVLLGLAYLGADLATRFQYLIMAALGAALVSFFVGVARVGDLALVRTNWMPSGSAADFWVLFAIFFPAVTGFTQGVSMSGDLKDPGRSLPLGTFLAVGISTVVYLGAMIALAAALPANDLARDYTAMKRIAAYAPLIDAGVLSATLSSALASFLGAPRILQALANDRVFTSLTFFSRTDGPKRNPRRAVLLTGAIALSTIFMGNLNAIAALVSMFFLVSYGLLNYATYIEATAASPSFRPRFRLFHPRASLAGTLICAGVMLAINPMAAAVALAILAAVYQYVTRTAIPSRWRDSRRAYRFRRVKEGLRELAREPEGPMDWQPQVLVFTQGADRRERVLRFASWITGGSGVTTAVQIVEGEGASELAKKQREEAEAGLRQEIEDHALDAFPLVVTAPDSRVAASTLVQAWGVGPIRANTVLLNWFESLRNWQPETASFWYARLLRNAIRLNQNVVVLDAEEAEWQGLRDLQPDQLRIDVWWWENESSRFALLLAYLMTRTEKWDEAKIRVLVPSRANAEKSVENNLAHRLEESRIDAEITPVVDVDADGIVEHSHGAGLVFLPLRILGMRVVDPFGDAIDSLLSRLPMVALVAAAQDIQLADEADEIEAAVSEPDEKQDPSAAREDED